MADRRISELTSLLGTNAADDDFIQVIDNSEANNADKNKSITLEELSKYLFPSSVNSFVPNFTSGTATFNNLDGFWYKFGKFMFFQARADVTAPATADLQLTIPGGFSVDTNFVLEQVGTSINDQFISAGHWLDGGIFRHTQPVYFTATVLKFSYEGGGALVGPPLTTGDRLNLNGLIPISEF